MYADDMVIWCTDELASVATKVLQRAVDALTAWANRWCVSINTDKCSTTLFTLSPKQKAGDIKINGEPLREDKQPTYLGVTFDDRLTWKHHINKAATKARRKLAILRKLSGTTWGANEKILSKVYQQGIRPHLEYGSTAWCPASNTTLQEIDKVQSQALRVITGAMKSTRIEEMEKVVAIQNLKGRRDTKVIIQADKIPLHTKPPNERQVPRPSTGTTEKKQLHSPSHPMKGRFQDLALGRLKRSSFIHQAKRLRREIAELPEVDSPLTFVPQQTPWREESGLQIHIQTEVPGVFGKDEQNEIQRRTVTLSFLDDEYPQHCWIRVYTDGSAQNAVKNGGAGIYIEYPNNSRDTVKIPTGKFCHNYDAEIQAIVVAIKKLLNTNLGPHPVVFLTDARSVLQALQYKKLPDLQILLYEMCRHCTVKMQWIPSHCGIPGNESADRLAKEGAAEDQPDVPITYHQKKKMIKSIRRSTYANTR